MKKHVILQMFTRCWLKQKLHFWTSQTLRVWKYERTNIKLAVTILMERKNLTIEKLKIGVKSKKWMLLEVPYTIEQFIQWNRSVLAQEHGELWWPIFQWNWWKFMCMCNHLKSLEVVLKANGKWRNIYPRKSIKIWQERWESVVFEPRPFSSFPLPAQ